MKSKNTTYLFAVLLAAFTVFSQGCKDDKGPTELNIESMLIGDFDLNGATSPDAVPTDAGITITFNTDIDPATANSSSITMVQDYDDTNIELTIETDGPVLFITPATELGTGTLYTLTITAGLLNTDELPLTQTVRTFTTEGTFSPAGILASWTFENTADDVTGDFDPLSTGVVDITYETSRNTAAGTAAYFNGNTSIIEIPNGDVLLNTDAFTLSFWMKTDSDGHVNENGDPTGHFVMGLGAFYGLQYEVYGNYQGAKFAIQYELGDGTTSAEDFWMPSEATDASNGGYQGWTYARSLTPEEMEATLKDEWVLVTVTYDASNQEGHLYYNGELMKSIDFDEYGDDHPKKSNVVGLKYGGAEPDVVNEWAFGFIQSRAGTMWDGESWGGYDFPTSQHFQGWLDDIKFYHKALTATEIQLMYDSEK